MATRDIRCSPLRPICGHWLAVGAFSIMYCDYISTRPLHLMFNMWRCYVRQGSLRSRPRDLAVTLSLLYLSLSIPILVLISNNNTYINIISLPNNHTATNMPGHHNTTRHCPTPILYVTLSRVKLWFWRAIRTYGGTEWKICGNFIHIP